MISRPSIATATVSPNFVGQTIEMVWRQAHTQDGRVEFYSLRMQTVLARLLGSARHLLVAFTSASHSHTRESAKNRTAYFIALQAAYELLSSMERNSESPATEQSLSTVSRMTASPNAPLLVLLIDFVKTIAARVESPLSNTHNRSTTSLRCGVMCSSSDALVRTYLDRIRNVLT